MAASGETGSIFDCPICLEKLRTPKYLPCLHSFCELCIRSFIDSSMVDCVKNHRTISFECPVCRCVNLPPSQNISSEKWAKELPVNHQLLTIQESYLTPIISSCEVLCDSCRQNGKHIGATRRCQQCNEYLCETCFKFIHERVKAFASHTFVELTSKNPETADDSVNCMVHSGKPIKVYCFDHEKLGCNFCLTTEHKDCKTVLALDEIAESDLENSSKSFITETKKMRELTQSVIQDTRKNINELNQQQRNILINVSKNIEDIKRELDSLHLKLEQSLQSAHKKEISELSSVLEPLENFNKILAKIETITSSGMQKGNRKHMFIATERNKPQLLDHLQNIKAMRKQMRRSTLEWTSNDAVNSLINLKNIGVFEYKTMACDYVTPIENYFKVIEKEGLNKKIESKKEAEEFVRRNVVQASIRILRGISTDYTMSTDTKLLAAAFDLRNSSWSCAFSPRGHWSDVRTINWCSMRFNMSNTLPASLLLNPDKSFRAFGYEAREQYDCLEDEQRMEFYFFQEITSVLDSQKTMNPQQTTRDDITGKKIETVTILERALNFLLNEFTRSIYNRWRIRDSLETDVKFAIILPTYISENIQQFVYETAVKSGFPRSSLFVVLEAEAAFFYYQCKETKGYEKDMEVQVGKKYLVACLGEKTSTLSVHKKSDDGTSDEILRISKGCWGMQSLLDEFETCLEEIIGKQQMQDIKTNLSSDYKNLTEEFGRKLKTMCDVQRVRIHVSIACDIVQWIEDHTLSSIEETFSSSEYSEKIKIRHDYKMTWSKDAILPLFDKTIKRIIEHIKTILDSDMVDIETILLFGSLSECIVIQNAVKEFFNTKRVVALHENAVLSGAVHIRHAIDCQDC